MSRYRLDTDFLVKATASCGDEYRVLLKVQRANAEIEMSALAWYEFCRGPRPPHQEALARSYREAEGVVAFDEELATKAADSFRQLGSSRKRAFDVAIAVSAITREARLLTGNTRDYSGIDGLQLGPEP